MTASRKPLRPKALLSGALLLLANVVGAGPRYLPAKDVPRGWKVVGEPQTFNADNLYEHINGAAPGYLRYDFRCLTVETLQLAEDPATEVLVEIYEFGNHLDAFGIYSNERAPKLEFLKLGAEGYFVGPNVRFYKGPYYVKLNATRDNETVLAAQQTIARSLAMLLSGETKHPPLVRAIPSGGLIANSERYEGSDLLAHDFLGAGFTADYDLKGEKPSKLFFTVKPDGVEARSAYYQLLSFLRKRGEIGERIRLTSGRGHMARHPFYGPSLICYSGQVVCGVLRTPSPEAGIKLLDELLDRLHRLSPTVCSEKKIGKEATEAVTRP
ncbi:MAG: DUF6599 family protein [Candidatus Zipacnadales bacterium]